MTDPLCSCGRLASLRRWHSGAVVHLEAVCPVCGPLRPARWVPQGGPDEILAGPKPPPTMKEPDGQGKLF